MTTPDTTALDLMENAHRRVEEARNALESATRATMQPGTAVRWDHNGSQQTGEVREYLGSQKVVVVNLATGRTMRMSAYKFLPRHGGEILV